MNNVSIICNEALRRPERVLAVNRIVNELVKSFCGEAVQDGASLLLAV